MARGTEQDRNSRRVIRTPATRIVFGLVGVTAIVVALYTALSFVLSEPAVLSRRDVGIARTGGHLAIYACVSDGVQAAEIRSGKGSGHLVWSATKEPGAQAARVLQVVPVVANYEVHEPAPIALSDGVIYLNRLDDIRGIDLLGSVLVFRPGQMRDGEIAAASGGIQLLSSWLTARTCS